MVHEVVEETNSIATACDIGSIQSVLYGVAGRRLWFEISKAREAKAALDPSGQCNQIVSLAGFVGYSFHVVIYSVVMFGLMHAPWWTYFSASFFNWLSREQRCIGRSIYMFYVLTHT